jgi:hypothetical protein
LILAMHLWFCSLGIFKIWCQMEGEAFVNGFELKL